jgi:hypothetical protein
MELSTKERGLSRHLEQAAKEQAEQHDAGNADSGVEEAGTAGVHHLLQIHAKTKGHYGGLQEQLGQRMTLDVEWMLDGKAECDTASQRKGGRNNATRRQEKTYEKDCSAVHGTTFGVLREAVQTEIMMANKQSTVAVTFAYASPMLVL